MTHFRLLTQDTHGESTQDDQLAIDVLTGLSAPSKHLSAKYFYDDLGSEIFQKITQHQDYYLTAKEVEIITNINKQLAGVIDEQEIDIIELGVGDGHKSQLIIDGFLKSGCKVNFYPIDISEKAMFMLQENIVPNDNLVIHGVVAEYFDGLKLVRGQSTNRQLVLFLGSNIGNFNREQSLGFLRKVWASLKADDFIFIGFDLKKDVKKLTAAYNDEDGLTAKFNLNLLSRINKELGANFELDKFQHFGVYNPVLGAMESYVLSTEKQEVYISALQRAFQFDAYEAVHFEYSYKFSTNDIERLSQQSGFHVVKHFTDSKQYFVDSLWQVVKEER
ncbi:L-histidine N(alpha)-methyltransferase [Pseudoalteromonas luteoviolacea]|uniref:L-histidine N(alpha)-methyltransferase n=1 Tax=Pseudoalteromonas luteoviolacea TaxID=43657 RepID=UPI001F3DCC07|nr:L-histidine N(alpha)-methyltransferase [Pseudoalteromonas luteoviolacea]MCF6439432.1 L-histidine N(alpha)-methyltransferase [Pseudoalteromonas luteoviolacea]